MLARPIASSPAVRRRMSKQRSRNTTAEMNLRKALHARGLRYRIHCRLVSDLRREADLAFIRAKVAVFVDGCFWHSCPEHGTSPKANGAWWAAKLAANRERDRDTDDRLHEAGWTSIRVWEHEDPVRASEYIAEVVRTAGACRPVVVTGDP